MVQVIKSLQDPLEVGNNLPGTRPGTEMFLNADGKLKETGRYHVVRQVVSDGGSGDQEGPAADGRQFHIRYQQTISASRAEGTPTRQIGGTNQLTQL